MENNNLNSRNRFNHTLFAIAAFFIVLSGCKKDDATPGGQKNASVVFNVDTNTRFQTIAGFGGANQMWGTEFMEPAEINKAFGTGANDLGLSIFRIRISSNPQEWPLILEAAQTANSLGAKIMASPWSPPPALKSNNSDVSGYLLPENYGAFKDHINDFIEYMESNGVDIYAVSVQNEPDYQVSYESCDWTSVQMGNFIAEFGDQIEGALLIAPESFNFSQTFTNNLLNNAQAAAKLDIVGGHIYGGGLNEFQLAAQQNKEVWMTEYLLNLGTGNSGAPAWTTYSNGEIWEESLEMLSTIHESMTLNWNAYIWWYIQRYYSFIGDGEQDTTDGAILKRGVAFSHFSKYVRPGNVRVEVSASKSNSLNVTAYDNGNQVVVVIINAETTSAGNVQFNLSSYSGATAISTTETLNRQVREVDLLDEGAMVNILPKSVTTVVIDK